MTALANITQQDAPPEVEFVDREFAEAEAKRAIALLNASDESKVEAWFALQAVADQVGPASNVGVQGISWTPPLKGRNTGSYRLAATCVDGPLRTMTGAPPTLEQACLPERLERACRALAAAVEKKGGLSQTDRRPRGVGDALVAAVSACPEGRAWLDGLKSKKSAVQTLTQMVKVADRYGREGVYAPAHLRAHTAFLVFPDRCELIRQYPTAPACDAKAMSLRAGDNDLPPVPRVEVRNSQVNRLAIRSGASTYFARAVLREVLEGRSKAQIIRAINEAVKMVEADPKAQRLKVAA